MKRIHRTNAWPKSNLWDTKYDFSVLWRSSSYWSGPWCIGAWSGCWGTYAQSVAWHYYIWKEYTELTYPANLSCGHTIGPVLGTAKVHRQMLGAGFGKNLGHVRGLFFWINLWKEYTELILGGLYFIALEEVDVVPVGDIFGLFLGARMLIAELGIIGEINLFLGFDLTFPKLVI